MDTDLPYIDTHTRSVAVGPAEVWTALRSYVEDLGLGGAVLPRLLGTSPPSGFAIVEEVPGERVALEGWHRFSRYRLVFAVEPRTEQRTTLLHAISYAEFPGLHGRAYRALVVSSRLHVLATNQLLRAIAARCADRPPRT